MKKRKVGKKNPKVEKVERPLCGECGNPASLSEINFSGWTHCACCTEPLCEDCAYYGNDLSPRCENCHMEFNCECEECQGEGDKSENCSYCEIRDSR